jgi:hypothetical protein
VRRIEEERLALKPSGLGDLAIKGRRFEAIRFDLTTLNIDHLVDYHKSFGKSLGDIGPTHCQFTSTILAREMPPIQVS